MKHMHLNSRWQELLSCEPVDKLRRSTSPPYTVSRADSPNAFTSSLQSGWFASLQARGELGEKSPAYSRNGRDMGCETLRPDILIMNKNGYKSYILIHSLLSPTIYIISTISLWIY